MCKCCQSCLESCYWHCCEVWWCYDENIALYEEPLSEEKDNRSFDNLAFWDSVSVIANRSVVTIQPLPENQNGGKDDNGVTRLEENLHKSLYEQRNYIKKEETERRVQIQENEAKKIEIPKENKNIEVKLTVTADTPDSQIKIRKKSAIEEKIEKRSGSISEDANRKKSLKERRKSAAGLTLKLDDDFHEIPVIRQSSVPKFYLDTPEVNQQITYISGHSSVLVSPILPKSPNFNYDLKSVVQFEKELENNSRPATPTQSRLTKVRRKLKPIITKKPSAKSLPDSINHM